MAKQQWKLNSFSNHIDPEKEEQLKRVKIVVEDQLKNILRITNDITHGNKERNLRKKSEAIELIEDFHKQYEKLYILYENLREKVKKSVDGEDDTSSSANDSDSESNYYPGEFHGENDEVTNFCSRVSERDDGQEYETWDVEYTPTCSSVVTKTMNSPGSPFGRGSGLGDMLRDIELQREKTGKISQMWAEMKDLEEQVAALKTEVSSLHTQNRQLEEQVEWKSNEAVETQEKISRLEAQIMEMEAESNEQERAFTSFSKQFVDDKQHYTSRISELEAQAEVMQLELNGLKHQKGELEVGLLDATKHWSTQVEGLTEHVSYLQHQLKTINSHKAELKLEIEKKSNEISEYLLLIAALRNELSLSEQQAVQEKESLKIKVQDLESEIESLSNTKTDLEEQVNKISHEASQSSLEKEKLQEKISQLSTKQNELKDCQTIMSVKMKSLEEEVQSLKSELECSERKRSCLQVGLEALQNDKKLVQLELEKEKEQYKSQLERITRSNFHQVERKIEEMAIEFRKQVEDQYRILSRRIRVAEQLQAENKEWYRKTRDTYERDNRDLQLMRARTATALKNVKDLTLTANDLLTSIDSKAFKFEECTAIFQSRISKASCEINFAKEWAMRKNEALSRMKEDLDCLLVQLDDKEAEILASREKVCTLENKVQELEKIIEEKEDEMLGLTEEKREAIRQLCVWIDYHRGQSDFYKNLLSDMNRGRRRAS
ncbi:hypothetical protein C2S53_000668 [Perilla frutescens var. hirtella]|uniref:NAB domain-containing protein n=1 Tax=Perilla frutescens var. hirtella TaxID=608512 RepID=A0AAD4J0T9_PERFH|nr:hypothetical protein C2S53_000668 [Perilla frutescens var. hirtella]